MRGVFPILVTPFDEAERVDEESLRSLVDFNVAAGVHGLGVALGSEVWKLTEAERDRVTRIVVDQARGRVPVVVNTGAAGTRMAIQYSQAAEALGADALMVMPPSFAPASPVEARQYFKAISDAVQIPIFIQDQAGAPVAPGLARQIADECEHARYLKAETPPTPPRIAEAVAQSGGLLTVFGGAGGNFFVEEMRRGAVGTMPSCSQPEAFVEIWDRFQAGDERGASEVLYRKVLPLNRVAQSGWGSFYRVHKEALRRRGVIRSATVRAPAGTPLDATAERELDEVIRELYG